MVKIFHDYLFSRSFALVCLVGIAIALLAPREGMGFSVCGMERLFGLPCPACGLTRSVSCFFQGHWIDAVQYNPFGPLVSLVMIFFCLLLFLPRRLALRWRAAIDRHDTAVCIAYVSFTLFFFTVGLIRLLMVWNRVGADSWFAGKFFQ